jgi:hypothetical protein
MKINANVKSKLSLMQIRNRMKERMCVVKKKRAKGEAFSV